MASQGTFAAGADQFGFLPDKVVQPPGSDISVGGVALVAIGLGDLLLAALFPLVMY